MKFMTGLGIAAVLLLGMTAQAQVGHEGARLDKAPELLIRPYVKYEVPGEAIVSWITEEPCATVLEYGDESGDRKQIKDFNKTTHHEVVITDLDPQTVYLYAVTTEKAGAKTVSVDYSFDTTFNYTVSPIDADVNPYGDDDVATRYGEAAEKILAESGISEGYCLVYGAGRGQLAFEIAKRSNLIVQGVDTDAKLTAQGRNLLGKTGIYGDRVTLHAVESIDALPFTSNYANLVVSDRVLSDDAMPGSPIEVARVTRPGGGVALIGRPDGDGVSEKSFDDWLGVASGTFKVDKTDGLWAKAVADPLPDAGAWSHQYGDAANTSNSGDTLRGAGKTNEMRVQWLGRPGADFGIDRNPRMPAPLSINGRLFHQGLNRMCGLDAYNGAMLWMLEVPGLRRVNIPRDGANWAADEDDVFVAIEETLWRVDGQKGELEHLFQLPDPATRSTHEWGIVMQADDLVFGSTVLQGGSYKKYWGGPAWYDQTEGEGTFKVCSDSIFAHSKDGEHRWTYGKGEIINASVTMAEGVVYFVESRNEKVLEAKTGRVELPELWLDQYLVALDAESGEVLWEEAIDTEDGVVIFFMTYTREKLLITSSTGGDYHLNTYAAQDGKLMWSNSHKWTNSHHGAHMIHPAIVGDIAFLEPMGYDMNTGEQVRNDLGRREGCATVAATSDALIYRGEARRVAMWDIESGEVTSWMNLRPSCWLSVVPSGGMILAPEGGGGCSCGTWVETSLGFMPDLASTD